MSAYYGEERAEALEEAGAEPEARPSPALSELSGEPGVEELQAVLQESYDPRKEGIESFEARVNRAAEPRDAYARHFLSVATFELCQAICSRFLVCSTFLVCSRFLESARICSRENP